FHRGHRGLPSLLRHVRRVDLRSDAVLDEEGSQSEVPFHSSWHQRGPPDAGAVWLHGAHLPLGRGGRHPVLPDQRPERWGAHQDPAAAGRGFAIPGVGREHVLVTSRARLARVLPEGVA
ncbi:rabK1, partial [Symbiodinium sp. KB8]